MINGTDVTYQLGRGSFITHPRKNERKTWPTERRKNAIIAEAAPMPNENDASTILDRNEANDSWIGR